MKKKLSQNPKVDFPKALAQKLIQRCEEGTLRSLKKPDSKRVDFSSNDYLGFSRHKLISEFALDKLKTYPGQLHGATGSRLLTGNYAMLEDFESYLQHFYNAEAATVFNSGYDANLGLLSAIAQRQDLILYDELSHASIRDGIGLSKAKAYKFQHNDLNDLKEKLVKFQDQFETIYVITEHVFSMDGDCADVDGIAKLCVEFGAYFILDEAHSIGAISKTGDSPFDAVVFARIITFGKSFGSHGAAVLGTEPLKQYLINFAKSFIYTTAPGVETTARNWAAHLYLESSSAEFESLRMNIAFFQKQIKAHRLIDFFIESQSAIQSCVIGGNEEVKLISSQLQEEGFDVRAILSPTVPQGKERLRFCLHSFNTRNEIETALLALAKYLIQ
ncbi:aminotransferase class I/II-fold pyridoxal phosphate-dependent enzyme [Psychroflexus sp. YR1-1]|uniref:Aminotransferase class I/II-fold pyridoxal phosphate-dependent enzyme n=1 Tax=Psychroflexus aurantiacus TaxID=2709310 RepID=A0A6B3QY64_9FLAO|nr:aminotransferase class I/II-fold pyridoxal phosphate-dependent enzyme [Psychroflexus aurantiacus]NEV92598.1 aminotransferase class I/II-fold pyridoxal phosphate-dependent enzyme [Psychroflexus aurantiacus]